MHVIAVAQEIYITKRIVIPPLFSTSCFFHARDLKNGRSYSTMLNRLVNRIKWKIKYALKYIRIGTNTQCYLQIKKLFKKFNLHQHLLIFHANILIIHFFFSVN